MKNWRRRLHEIIFEADTRAGRLFDVALILAIVLSLVVTMLTSVESINRDYRLLLLITEWILTVGFSIEYLLRIIVLVKPKRYIFSAIGFVDFMAFFPSYLELFLPGGRYLNIIRVLRIIRVFRILKLAPYIKQLEMLRFALFQSRRKITVFAAVVFSIVIILGAMMYVIEGPEHGFTSIPRSIYWAIVTLTTVGYGDISPQTILGQSLSAFMMLMGYAIIAVPTGILTVEMTKSAELLNNTQSCRRCGLSKHDGDAIFCKCCGNKLN